MLRRIIRDPVDGQGLSEYALVMLLVSITAVTILGLMGIEVTEFLETVPDAFNR